MTSWEKPKHIKLACALEGVVQGLREILPQLVEAQVRNLEGMAKTLAAGRGLVTPAPSDQPQATSDRSPATCDPTEGRE